VNCEFLSFLLQVQLWKKGIRFMLHPTLWPELRDESAGRVEGHPSSHHADVYTLRELVDIYMSVIALFFLFFSCISLFWCSL
jgi:hypothetical protein